MLLKKMTAPEVAKKTGTHEATVYEWLRKYRENPGDFMPGSGNFKKCDKELKDLEKRVRELEKENEFLKKRRRILSKIPCKIRRNQRKQQQFSDFQMLQAVRRFKKRVLRLAKTRKFH